MSSMNYGSPAANLEGRLPPPPCFCKELILRGLEARFCKDVILEKLASL